MAQVSGQLHPASIVGIKEVIVDELFELDPRQTPVLQAIGAGPDGALNTLSKPCTDQAYKWLETSLTTNRTTLNAALTSGATSADLVDANFTRDGDRIYIDTELIDVTTGGADPSVIVRGVGGTTAAAHSAGAVVVNLGNSRFTGTSLPTAVSDQPTLKTNYTRIWHEAVDVSGTADAIAAYGRTSEFDTNLMQVMRRIKEQLEHEVLFGGTAVQGGAATAGRMAGCMTWITSNVQDALGGTLSMAHLRTAMESMFNAGGSGNLIMVCGSFNKQVINGFKLPNVRYNDAEGAGSYGVSVDMIDAGIGTPIKVITKQSFPQSLVMLLNADNIGVGPLQGREFAMTPIGTVGDRRQASVIGEYTCEVRLEKSHAIIKNTAVS